MQNNKRLAYLYMAASFYLIGFYKMQFIKIAGSTFQITVITPFKSRGLTIVAALLGM